jgi:hypothetical protein
MFNGVTHPKYNAAVKEVLKEAAEKGELKDVECAKRFLERLWNDPGTDGAWKTIRKWREGYLRSEVIAQAAIADGVTDKLHIRELARSLANKVTPRGLPADVMRKIPGILGRASGILAALFAVGSASAVYAEDGALAAANHCGRDLVFGDVWDPFVKDFASDIDTLIKDWLDSTRDSINQRRNGDYADVLEGAPGEGAGDFIRDKQRNRPPEPAELPDPNEGLGDKLRRWFWSWFE